MFPFTKVYEPGLDLLKLVFETSNITKLLFVENLPWPKEKQIHRKQI